MGPPVIILFKRPIHSVQVFARRLILSHTGVPEIAFLYKLASLQYTIRGFMRLVSPYTVAEGQALGAL